MGSLSFEYMIPVFVTPNSYWLSNIAALLSAYIFFDIYLEEKSLQQQFADKYPEYKRSIGLFFSFRW